MKSTHRITDIDAIRNGLLKRIIKSVKCIIYIEIEDNKVNGRVIMIRVIRAFIGLE